MSIDGNGRPARPAGEVVVSTEQVETKLRTDFWREATRFLFDTLPVTESGSPRLEGSITSRPVGRLLVGSTTFNAQRYNRDRRVIVLGGLDNYLIQVFTEGDMSGDFAGASMRARPGDICILDLAQALQNQVSAGSRLSIAIPRQLLSKAVGHQNLHGVVLKANQPMTVLLRTYLEGLRDLQGALSDDEAAAAEDALVGLLAAALRGQQSGVVQAPPVQLALRQRVLDFIDANLNHPELNPAFIVQRLNVSRAHLYRAFADEGGIATVVRSRRLDAAFLELASASAASRTIAQIAERLGFSSTNQLLRAFRARFGMTPSEAREEGLSALARDGQGKANLLDHFAAVSNWVPKP